MLFRSALPGLLRALYSNSGYSRYRTVGFEEYDLFTEYRDFLTSGQMITFTGAGGRLLALKPDITMSIIRDASEERGRTDKFFYSESVYRVPAGGDEFKEILQIGLECIGDICAYDRAEVVSLACRTLAVTGCDYMLDISHTGLIDGVCKLFGISERGRAELARMMKDKNAPGFAKLCAHYGIKEDDTAKLIELSRKVKGNRRYQQGEKMEVPGAVKRRFVNKYGSVCIFIILKKEGKGL